MWVIGRNRHRGRVGFFRWWCTGRVRLTPLELYLAKKGLVIGTLTPGSFNILFRNGRVDATIDFGKIVIRLANVEGEITDLTHQFGNRFHSRR